MENQNQLIDSFGRVHNNLRISVTDRCNIRCFYCMPAENVQFMHRSKIMSFEEIVKFVRLVVPLGVNKIRLTGGEPLVRKGIPDLVKLLAEIPGIEDIGITTNGILLPKYAQQLYDAGLRRINISLDALNAKKFQEITLRDEYDKVIEGIQSAHAAGFKPIKINA
ncbi:MAG: radical SAM protein, partial [Gimesia sp.]